MAEQKLLFKRGTKAALEAALVGDKKPAAGEPIYEIQTANDTTTTAKLKIGDGVNDYANLPYVGTDSGSGEPSEYIKSASISGNKLTLTKKDGTTVVYEPDLTVFATKEELSAEAVARATADAALQTNIDAEATTRANKDAELAELIATKSTVSASAGGTSTTEVGYITIDGTQYKLAGGGTGSSANVYQADCEAGAEHTAVIEAALAGNTPKKGDIAIVKERIAEGADKRQYTAYVYTGAAWAAMDGNYSADNVYFADNITLAGEYTAVGNVKLVDKTLSAKGKSVAAMFKEIFTKELYPTVKTPVTLTINSSNIGAKEAGTNIAVAYATVFNPGAYTYGPDTGITASNYKISFNGETLTGTSGTFASVQVTDSTNLSISGTFDHTAGSIPVTNLGNLYPAAQIGAASGKSAGCFATALTGYRNLFLGTLNDKTTELTSPVIRTGLGANKIIRKAATGTYQLTIAPGVYRTVLAVPAAFKVTSVKDANNSMQDIFGSFKQVEGGINVEGAEGYTAINYNVYVLTTANPVDVQNTFHVVVANA